MKKTSKLFVTLSLLIALLFNLSMPVSASSDYWEYTSKTKMYTMNKACKGKLLNKKSKYPYYKVTKITKDKIWLKKQAGWQYSADPVFKGKSKAYKLSSKCKFYYSNVAFPVRDGKVLYKRLSLKTVKKIMKSDSEYGYFGEVYVKNGKVVSVFCWGGD